MPERKRVLIFFSDTGGGHRSAAAAIAEALELRFPGRYEVAMVDFLKDHAPPPFNLAPAAYSRVARYRRAWQIGFAISDGHRRARALTAAAWPYVRSSVRRLVRAHPADVYVSVHPLLVAPIWKALGSDHPPFVVVVTDLVSTHALWFHRKVDLTLVPTEVARRRALECGLLPERVRVTGLPVQQRFSRPPSDRERLRRDLGWPLDLPMVLVVGGGEGMGPLFKTARAVAAAGGGCGLAIVAGRNEGLRRQLEGARWQVPTFVYGFERRMPEMMRAADLLVTKAGALTLTEAINAGLPMVVYSRVPGQEDGNVDYVVEKGVGKWAPGPERTAAAVREWLADPEELSAASRACLRIARPRAAIEVSEAIDALARPRWMAEPEPRARSAPETAG